MLSAKQNCGITKAIKKNANINARWRRMPLWLWIATAKIKLLHTYVMDDCGKLSNSNTPGKKPRTWFNQFCRGFIIRPENKIRVTTAHGASWQKNARH